MRRIVSEPGLRASLGAQGFALAASSLNARLQSAKLEALLLSVAAGAASQKASGRAAETRHPGFDRRCVTSRTGWSQQGAKATYPCRHFIRGFFLLMT